MRATVADRGRSGLGASGRTTRRGRGGDSLARGFDAGRIGILRFGGCAAGTLDRRPFGGFFTGRPPG
jgi:hypothetical protein